MCSSSYSLLGVLLLTLLSSTLAAALEPRSSPICSFTCRPPPDTTPDGKYLDRTLDGPYFECDYSTSNLYGTGPASYGCLYTYNASAVSGVVLPNTSTL